jgi:hypothetical protein
VKFKPALAIPVYIFGSGLQYGISASNSCESPLYSEVRRATPGIRPWQGSVQRDVRGRSLRISKRVSNILESSMTPRITPKKGTYPKRPQCRDESEMRCGVIVDQDPGTSKRLSHCAPMWLSRCSLPLVGNSPTPRLCPHLHLRQFRFTLNLPQGFPK